MSGREKEIEDQLKYRLQEAIDHYGGTLPERTAIAWSAYISACSEWGVISISGGDRLYDMLPKIKDDPTLDILLGWGEDREGIS